MDQALKSNKAQEDLNELPSPELTNALEKQARASELQFDILTAQIKRHEAARESDGAKLVHLFDTQALPAPAPVPNLEIIQFILLI